MVDMVMPVELAENETLVEQEAAAIERIKKIRPTLGDDVVILGHHYQRDEVIQFADFQGANLTGANLMWTDAGGAYFSEADLTGSNFTMADIQSAKFFGARGVNSIIGLDRTLNRGSASFD